MTSARKTFQKNAITGAAIVANVLLRRIMDPIMGPDAPYITVYPTVILVAVLFGPGPGFLAGALGVMAAQIWLTGPFGVFKFTLADFWRAAYLGYVGKRYARPRTAIAAWWKTHLTR